MWNQQQWSSGGQQSQGGQQAGQQGGQPWQQGQPQSGSFYKYLFEIVCI